MKSSLIAVSALVAVLFLTLPPGLARPSDEAPPSSGAPTAEGKKKGSNSGVPFRGQVGSVDSTARTVTLSGKKKDRVLHVTDQTRIERDGKPAAIGDIKPGDSARGSVSKDAEGREVLLKATFGERTAEAAKSDGAASRSAQAGL